MIIQIRQSVAQAMLWENYELLCRVKVWATFVHTLGKSNQAFYSYPCPQC